MICCHLFPGIECTIDDFLDFSINSLNLKKEWLQFSNKNLPHFDISLSKRKLAIGRGVKEIENEDMIKIIIYWKNKNIDKSLI